MCVISMEASNTGPKLEVRLTGFWQKMLNQTLRTFKEKPKGVGLSNFIPNRTLEVPHYAELQCNLQSHFGETCVLPARTLDLSGPAGALDCAPAGLAQQAKVCVSPPIFPKKRIKSVNCTVKGAKKLREVSYVRGPSNCSPSPSFTAGYNSGTSHGFQTRTEPPPARANPRAPCPGWKSRLTPSPVTQEPKLRDGTQLLALPKIALNPRLLLLVSMILLSKPMGSKPVPNVDLIPPDSKGRPLTLHLHQRESKWHNCLHHSNLCFTTATSFTQLHVPKPQSPTGKASLPLPLAEKPLLAAAQGLAQRFVQASVFGRADQRHRCLRNPKPSVSVGAGRGVGGLGQRNAAYGRVTMCVRLCFSGYPFWCGFRGNKVPTVLCV